MEDARKIRTLEQIARLVGDAQAAGERVVLCHGCFDLVHPGHVRHLQEARRLGDRLVVTITGDTLVDKGTGRPLIPQDLRAENLAALDCVSWVAVNSEPTAVELLQRVRPDLYVKGREYRDNRDPRFAAEKAAVEAYGGRLAFTSGDVVFSSTALVEAMEHAADPTHRRLRGLLAAERLDEARAEQLVDDLAGRTVAVVGETIADTYVLCARPEVATEGPMMTLRPLETKTYDGGAAVVARHLAAMGARPRLVTVLPDTDAGHAVVERLHRDGVETQHVTHAAALGETRRFVVGSTKVVKLDEARVLTLDESDQRRLRGLARDAARDTDATIVADYGQGLFTSTTLGELCVDVRPETGLLVGDVSGRRTSLDAMTGFDLLCPGETELRATFHDYDSGLSAVAWKLLHETSTRAAIVTLGGEGAAAFETPSHAVLAEDDWATRLHASHVPALVPHAVDELGCGDAMLAAATLARLAGVTLTTAAILGQVAAAAESGRLGNVAVGASDLRRGLRRLLATHLTVTCETDASSRDQLHPAHA